jgi:hypothetical protein
MLLSEATVNDRVTRRTLLRGALGIGALGAVGWLGWETLSKDATAEVSTRAISMAMHVHSSFSEGTGSMRGQLAEAVLNGIDVVWWTDHDWRMTGQGYRSAVHFSGRIETEHGNDPLVWKMSRSGSLLSSRVLFDTTRVSPHDPFAKSSLRLAATGAVGKFATTRVVADDSRARQNLKGTISGQVITFDVFPRSMSKNVFLELRIKLSNQPASGGRAAGDYTLLYRVGGPDAPDVHRALDRSGYVGLAAPANRWSTISLEPTRDIALLWPDLLPADSAIQELSFAAGSRSRAPAVFSVGNLQFSRTTTPLEDQRVLMDALASKYPSVTQLQGTEVSLAGTHLNWFGSRFALPDYGTTPILPPPDDPAATTTFAGEIHEVGGLSSLNHPFGSDVPALATQTKQDTARRLLAAKLIGNRAYGADILEVGYQSRGGMGLGTHLGLWDSLSRNGIFLTGNGVNDAHGGDWARSPNRFVTWAWATDSTESNLLRALAAGRIWIAEPTFRGTIDLLVDGSAPMGSVSVSDRTTRSLQLTVTGMPEDGSVRLVTGPVDYAGPTVPDPDTVSQRFATSDFSSGPATVSVNTTLGRFARLEVIDSTGRVVAVSNPVWMLRADPPGGLPAERADASVR